MTRFQVSKMVEDLGGAAAIAKATGMSRTTPYGWIERNYVSSRALEKIKAAFPEIDIDTYFEEHTHEQTGRRS